jgi:hypothetical protein
MLASFSSESGQKNPQPRVGRCFDCRVGTKLNPESAPPLKCPPAWRQRVASIVITTKNCAHASSTGTDRAHNPRHEPGQKGANPQRRAFLIFATFCPDSCPVAGAFCPGAIDTVLVVMTPLLHACGLKHAFRPVVPPRDDIYEICEPFVPTHSQAHTVYSACGQWASIE